jgi:hypothetical protein
LALLNRAELEILSDQVEFKPLHRNNRLALYHSIDDTSFRDVQVQSNDRKKAQS